MTSTFWRGVSATFLLAFSLLPAQAATVEIMANGVSYRLSTITGTYEELVSQLLDQAWWQNGALAEELSSTAGDLFGAVNFTQGAYFAFEPYEDGFLAATLESESNVQLTEAGFGDVIYTFVIEEEILATPLPAALIFALSGLVALASLRRFSRSSNLRRLSA